MTALADLFDLYTFPSGRRANAQRTIRPIAEELGQTAIVEHIDVALAHDMGVTRKLEHQWHLAKSAQASGEAVNAYSAQREREDRSDVNTEIANVNTAG